MMGVCLCIFCLH